MRWAQRLALMAVLLLWLLAAWILHPSPRPVPEAPGTVEPTLPLVIDLRLEDVEHRAPGGSARLDMVLDAGSPIERLTLSLRLPEGLVGRDLPAAAFGSPVALAEGESRTYVVLLAASREGAFPVRVEAVYALPDGRVFRTQQGATLSLGDPPRPGRPNAGAYEFMGVPLQELSR